MMNNEERNAKVVITADTQQYQKGVQAAAVETGKLEKSINGLVTKMDGLLKRTGKKMVLIGAADIAALTAASAVAATLEKQMSDMEAAAVNMKGALDMGSVKDNIRSLSREFPVARGEIVQLETAITNMGLSATNQVNSMTRAFIQLGGATGESSVALAQGQIGLSRQLGTVSSNPQTMTRQNDATTALSAQGGVSATDMLSFSQSIAPVAAMSGMTENQVKGVSTAFIRAGADGTYASNVFAKMANDLVRMQQTGSPDIQKYANVLGVSGKEISGMNPVDILDRLTKQTAAGGNMRTLDYLGFDSIRAQKALQGVAAGGGVQKWVDVADEASKSKKSETEQAADVAFSGFFDSMEQLRNRFTDITQVIGEPILKPLTMLANALNTLMSATQPLIDVFGKVVGIGGGLGGVGMIAGGMALKSWAGISTPMIAKRVASSTFGESVRFGLSHGSMRAGGLIPDDAVASKMVPGTPGGFGAVNRGVYGAMGRVGGLFPGMYDPSGTRVGFGNPFRTGINMGLMGAGHAVTSGAPGMDSLATHYKRGSLASGHERIGYEGRGRGFWSSMGAAARNGPMHEIIGDRPGAPRVPVASNIADTKASSNPLDQLRIKMAEIMASLRTAVNTATTALVRFAKSLGTAAGAKMNDIANNASTKSAQAFAATLQDGTVVVATSSKTIAEYTSVHVAATKTKLDETRQVASSMPVWKMLRKQMAETGASFYQLAAAATRSARGMAGTAVGSGLNMAGKGAMGALSMMGGNPYVMAAGAAAFMGFQSYSGNQYLDKRLKDISERAVETSNGLLTYNEALGISTDALIGFTGAIKQAAPTNTTQALDADTLRTEAMANGDYTNKNVESMDRESAMGWLRSLGPMSPKQMREVGIDIQRKFGEDSQNILSVLKGGPQEYNNTGYEKSFQGIKSINTAVDIPEVGAWDNLISRNAGNESGYLDKLMADGSPIAAMTDTAFQQAAGNVDYVASNLSTNKGDKADALMNQATAINEYSSVLTEALEGVTNNAGSKSGLENAAAMSSIAKTMQLLGVEQDKIDETLKNVDIPTQDFAGKSDEERKQWVWDTIIKPNVSTDLGSITEVEDKAAGPYTSKRQFTAQTEETMKTITSVNRSFEGFADQFGKNGLFASLAVNPLDPKLGAKSIEALKEIAKNTSGEDFGKAEAMLRTLGATDIAMQPFTDAAIAENRATQARQLTGANQAVQGQAVLGNLTGAIGGMTNKPESYAAVKESKGAAEDWIASWYAKLKEYNKMMNREEIDYQINRERTQADHNRQIAFSQEDFYRGQRYQKQDFHRSMLRQEEDYQVQLTRMVEDASRTMYDPFARVMSQGARSGSSEIYNLQHQNELMKEQRQGIDKLKKMGLSRAAIDDLGLMDPGKAQQVAYWADGGISKKEVGKMNREIGKRRDNAESLTITDDNQGYRRGEEDRKKMIGRSVDDFHRGLKRSTNEFLRQMERGEKEYRRSLNRMDEDREKNLKRARKDMMGFIKDSQKTVDEQAAYVTKILGKMHNKVGDKMIDIVDKMIEAIDKAEGKLKGDKKRDKTFSDARDTYESKQLINAHGTANVAPGSASWEDQRQKQREEHLKGHADGGIATKARVGVFGEAGPEALIPLNQRGAKFMADMLMMNMGGLTKGSQSSPTKADYMKSDPEHYRNGVYGFYDQRTGKWRAYPKNMEHMPMVQNSREHHVRGKNMSFSEAKSAMNVYNNSTNFNGQIHIEAQDPDEMARKLKHKGRMSALRGGKSNDIYS